MKLSSEDVKRLRAFVRWRKKLVLRKDMVRMTFEEFRRNAPFEKLGCNIVKELKAAFLDEGVVFVKLTKTVCLLQDA